MQQTCREYISLTEIDFTIQEKDVKFYFVWYSCMILLPPALVAFI